MCKHCWDDYYPEHHKDFIRGGVKVEDFDDEVKYRKPLRKSRYGRNKRSRTPRGCEANGHKAHVWVWTTEKEITDIFFKHFGFHKKESRVCCGCGKIDKTRDTEEYMRRKERAWRKLTGGEFDVKRGEPVERYRWRGMKFYSFTWEMRDPVYKEIYDAWHEEQMRRWRAAREWYSFPRY